jgi:hypothetical protein
MKAAPAGHRPRNKGKLVDPKTQLQPKHVWAMRTKPRVISVREILANPDKFDGERFADPHDRDYRGDKRVAVVYANSHNTRWPYLFSHAHGGKNYRLDKGSL